MSDRLAVGVVPTFGTMTVLLVAQGEEPTFVTAHRLRWRDRARARLLAARLDRLLAAGASPDASPALSLRASRLIGRSVRDEVARSLRRVHADARGRRHPLDPRLPVNHARVLRCAGRLEGLIELLAGDEPVAARGVARARVLVSEGASPLYARGGAGLERALDQTVTSLAPVVAQGPPGWGLVDV